MPVVVQLNHPVPEHTPPRNLPDQEWNRKKHRRKFLVSRGRCVAAVNSAPVEHDLAFWGEWEPPSHVIGRWCDDDSLPRFLHRPFWSSPPRGGRQNTDPWVFGECFRYSNCGQRVAELRNLTRGSLILFGSTIDGNFVLDTAFVVRGPGRPFSSSRLARVADKAFRVCTLESLVTTCGRNNEFILYRGVTFEERRSFGGMYSFVPCRRADTGEMRFPRPSIASDYVEPIRWKRRPHASADLALADVVAEWKSIRDEVLKRCMLGISFETPQREKRK
jgi:hypothetical protein